MKDVRAHAERLLREPVRLADLALAFDETHDPHHTGPRATAVPAAPKNLAMRLKEHRVKLARL
jgi:hypothetical protein